MTTIHQPASRLYQVRLRAEQAWQPVLCISLPLGGAAVCSCVLHAGISVGLLTVSAAADAGQAAAAEQGPRDVLWRGVRRGRVVPAPRVSLLAFCLLLLTFLLAKPLPCTLLARQLSCGLACCAAMHLVSTERTSCTCLPAHWSAE